MQHRKQTHKACLAYALWQIGVVSEEAVREYERLEAFESWESIQSWLDIHLSELDNLKSKLYEPTPGSATTLKGKGIIGLRDRYYSLAHTISYEDGVVLDSDREEGRMSLDKYLELYPRWEVVEIVPVGEEK